MKIFIGYDSREDVAYRVCEASLQRTTSVPLDIQPIKQRDLRQRKIYTRGVDRLSSTEFSFTRFLTPYLAGYKGWALFMDCDFLIRHDISTLLDYCDGSNALYCVHHNYLPEEATKMDGKIQTHYPYKNWSSFMWINCEHPDVKKLTPDVVNMESGLYLHQFKWLSDESSIGELPIAYNYLEGWYNKDDCPNPIAVHFTRGGPWLKDYMRVEYGDEWVQLAKRTVYE